MRRWFTNLGLVAILLVAPFLLKGQTNTSNKREKLLFDFGWKFAYGHPYDASKDFNFGTAYFSYLAKAGYGDGPAAANFDDRAWRILDLPHDFAVEQPFSNNGSHSHGYKAIGRSFPDVSVGWYRKTFEVLKEDLGRRFVITFDGVHRESKVFLNGHFLGNEKSGYSSFSYDLTDYLNYGGKNTIAVRVDVTEEEGWYYEGAGIYRHVWLTKTNPLHVGLYGTFVYSELKGDDAIVTVETTVDNNSRDDATYQIKQDIYNENGRKVSEFLGIEYVVKAGDSNTTEEKLYLGKPLLWSPDAPHLHKVITYVLKNNEVVDRYETVTGIRTIVLDPNEGCFVNGKHIKLKGTDNHQDHAGVGTAMPDELINFRVAKLKEMGSNSIRSSHNPATPELLDACDRMGMLVIDEHRLMGTAPFVMDQMERLIKRDRNHPSVLVWSMGNEEWAIEGNIVGERIIATMQAFAKKLDPTRMTNAASSGGWGNGVSKHIEVMGFNYLNHGNTDDYHRDFPNTPCIGTEEGSTNTTRGIYFDDDAKHMIAAYDRPTPNGYFFSIEHCWKHYNSRDYLAGMFIWTGFDYRGEPTPYGWPSISSYFGMYDVCGFPKDNVWYLKSWWGNEPVLHLLPHWNWKGKEGDTIKVVAYSNCDEVELFVNKKSVGRKKMENDSHLEWMVPYKAGSLKAIGYKNGKKQLEEIVETTGEETALKLESNKPEIKANGSDLAILTVSTLDKIGRAVPTSNNMIHFEIEGPGKIIGVGNGDPTCLEPDKYVEQVQAIKINLNNALLVDDMLKGDAIATNPENAEWEDIWSVRKKINDAKAIVYRGEIELPEDLTNAQLTLFYNCIGHDQNIYINGKQIAENLSQKQERHTLKLSTADLNPGKNDIVIVATPYVVRNSWESPNTDPGVLQVIFPAKPYKRSLFSGLAQVIIQSTGESGTIKLTAKSEGLEAAIISIEAK